MALPSFWNPSSRDHESTGISHLGADCSVRYETDDLVRVSPIRSCKEKLQNAALLMDSWLG
jgi:hypothetical protein